MVPGPRQFRRHSLLGRFSLDGPGYPDTAPSAIPRTFAAESAASSTRRTSQAESIVTSKVASHIAGRWSPRDDQTPRRTSSTTDVLRRIVPPQDFWP
jgi:hypothetical protein